MIEQFTLHGIYPKKVNTCTYKNLHSNVNGSFVVVKVEKTTKMPLRKQIVVQTQRNITQAVQKAIKPW